MGEDRTHMIHVTAGRKKDLHDKRFVRNSKHSCRYAYPAWKNGAFLMLRRGRIGVQLLFRLQGVRRDLMYHPMAVGYGPHQVRMGQFPSLIQEKKNWRRKLTSKVLGANRLKFTPDGKQVFISSLQTGELTIFMMQNHIKK